MGLFQTIRRTFDINRAAEAKKITQQLANAIYSSPICSDYENVFAQVRPLIDEMTSVVPYGIGRNGARKPLETTEELAALYAPNKTMGGIEFLDTMFSTWLTENQLYIRVHKKGGHIVGYTLLPATSFHYVYGGVSYWTVENTDGTLENIYSDEVMTLCYSRNPRDFRGVSPASAVRIYAQIDDLLAQFEKAYLENGAIPASVTIIRASTQEKFNEARQDLERQLKGASNRNKTLYLWRQFNNDDGTERDQVEVKTIQGNNNTLAIQELADIVNDRLNKAYGVSNFILGDDASAKYDNAELSDFQFTRRRVKPALRKFWAEFKHELDRITGGLGYDIRFDLDMPELTDRKKVEAETAEKTTQNLIRLIEAGSKPIAACVALGLKLDYWKDVAVGISNRVQVDREHALQSATEAPLAVGSSAPETETNNDPDTKAKEITPQRDQLHHHHEHTDDAFTPFTDNEKTEKAIFERLMSIAKAVMQEQPNIDLDAISNEIFELLEDEANNGGQAALEAIYNLGDDEIQNALADLIKNGVDISEGLAQRIHERTNELVQGYEQHTREIMRSVLENSENLTKNEIEERLLQAIPEGRAATIARNETVYAFKSGRLELDERIAQEFNLTIDLVWQTSPEAGEVCPLCKAMEGQRTRLGKAFIPQEATWTTIDKDGNETTHRSAGWEPSMWNDYGQIPNAHVNCVLGDTIVKADSVKLATKMNYSGDIVELKTRGGKKLAVTPNHILLTDRGWVAAKNIKNTDKVIAYSDSVERAMSDDAIDGKNPTIADEFVALSKTPGVVAIEVPVTAEDFKGDGIANEKVEVILAESLLRNKRDAASIKLGGKLPFVGGKFTDGTLFGLGSIDQLLVGVLLATNGIVGSTGKALTLLGSEGGHPEISRLTSATAYNARLNEAAANSSTADIKAFSKSFLAEAGLIEFDDVIDIKIYSVHNAPVYDVETTSTLYTANGIISSNCKCYFDEELVRTA